MPLPERDLKLHCSLPGMGKLLLERNLATLTVTFCLKVSGEELGITWACTKTEASRIWADGPSWVVYYSLVTPHPCRRLPLQLNPTQNSHFRGRNVFFNGAWAEVETADEGAASWMQERIFFLSPPCVARREFELCKQSFWAVFPSQQTYNIWLAWICLTMCWTHEGCDEKFPFTC